MNRERDAETLWSGINSREDGCGWQVERERNEGVTLAIRVFPTCRNKSTVYTRVLLIPFHSRTAWRSGGGVGEAGRENKLKSAGLLK